MSELVKMEEEIVQMEVLINTQGNKIKISLQM